MLRTYGDDEPHFLSIHVIIKTFGAVHLPRPNTPPFVQYHTIVMPSTSPDQKSPPTINAEAPGIYGSGQVELSPKQQKNVRNMELGMKEEHLHDTLRQADQEILFGVASGSEDEDDLSSVPINVRDVRYRSLHNFLHGPAMNLVLSSLAALVIGFGIGTATQNWHIFPRGAIGVTGDSDSASPADAIMDGFGAPPRYHHNITAIPRPPLSQLIHNNTIVGDVSWELDFAVIGFPKCGTSYLMRYLERGEELYLNDHELCTLTFNDPTRLVKMYHGLDRITADGQRRIKVGLKCPKDSESDWGLQHYSTYWPNTDFIVTMRHPVWWFQSFYNYRSYQHYPRRMHDPLDLIGPCRDDHPGQICAHKVSPKDECTSQNVCTDRSNFHYPLSRLQKTPMNTTRELELLAGRTMDTMSGLKGRVFLMEVGYLGLEGSEQAQFIRDLSNFLGMEMPLPPFPPHTREFRYEVEERRQDFIDICDGKFIPVRAELLKGGKATSEWLRDFFLKSDEVIVSQRHIFLELISKWSIDPCENVEA